MDRPDSSDADRIFQALGDATRRRLIDLLGGGPRSVSELAGPLEVTVTAVMQHLRVLEECGLVATEKIGRVRACRLRPEGLDVLDGWIRARRSRWEHRLDALAEILREP
ncbi:helix-turn-helix transcriptional regulator [Sphingosinicella sp. BN140058]|uniref:ArsR/SmtB family transcription factor n=1 Tax=Sphingosinicella sp. BN140058 TaxID=1892855 RepID=UPI001012E07F|nr:metalloregulator ArsR/SmtB family transcription factor [Sphingosinicella sp. BN140058]QAY77585.1 transcriptional regulator [Sphingosinicella sp. BN140058]